MDPDTQRAGRDVSPAVDGARQGDDGRDRARLLALLRRRSLRRGDFVLASGARSSYYIDGRRTTMSGEGQRLIGRLGLDALHDAGWAPGLVGGLTLGADPVAYAIAHASASAAVTRPAGADHADDHETSAADTGGARSVIDAFTVRKQPKDHGTGRRIEGAFEPGSDVVVVEDVVTTGESAVRAVAAVREAGSRVLGVLCVVDREEGGAGRLAREGLELLALFSVGEILAED